MTPHSHPPEVTVQLWPGLAIFSALQLVLHVDEVPGIGEDFEQLSTRIRPPLADEIARFLLAHIPSVLTDLSLEASVQSLPPEDFFHWVESLDPVELARRARAYGEQHGSHKEIHAVEAEDGDSPSAWVHAEAESAQWERLQQLLDEPVALHEAVAGTLRRFWTVGFRELYQEHQEAMEHVFEALQDSSDLSNPTALFERVLGRSLPDIEASCLRFPSVWLIPFPFMGPYVMSMSMEEPEKVLLLGFDAKRAWISLRKALSGPEISKLKALADETRLKILRFVSESERFGGDIVTHLGISQPGVSRHLRLLTASGLLQVRREGTSKFYSIGNRQLDALAKDIQQLKFTSWQDDIGGTH